MKKGASTQPIHFETSLLAWQRVVAAPKEANKEIALPVQHFLKKGIIFSSSFYFVYTDKAPRKVICMLQQLPAEEGKKWAFGPMGNSWGSCTSTACALQWRARRVRYYSLPHQSSFALFCCWFSCCFFFLSGGKLLVGVWGYAFLTQRITLTTPDFGMEQSSDSRMVIKQAEKRKSVSALVFCVF